VTAPDQWTRETPRTAEALVQLRTEAVADYAPHIGTIDAFTCDDCPRALICELAFDAYNTDGDCLYDK